MERFELDPKLKEEIRARVLGEGFMKLVQSVRRGGQAFRISLRPVSIASQRMFQAEMVDDGRVQVKNFAVADVAAGLEEILDQRGARDLHLMTATGDLHLRVTRKGHALVSRSAETNRVVTLQPHDHVKKLPLTSFDATALLRTIGLADGEGRIRASKRGKYDQVNEFLKVVGETVGAAKDGATDFTVVDCGCGKAYLTLSLWYYLTFVLGYANVRIVGVDRRHDVVDAATHMAAQLDLSDKVTFVEADLSTFDLSSVNLSTLPPSHCSTVPPSNLSTVPPFHLSTSPQVDLVCSLHACDTATDEALAKGVEWKARYILSAPCCQHELQKVLGKTPTAFDGLLRQSILRERLCDILTDSFRAQILRILGFKTQVVEFVSSEATARNILIRAEYGVKPGQPGPVGEYLNLRDYWKVTPWLETRLQALLGKHLRRYE